MTFKIRFRCKFWLPQVRASKHIEGMHLIPRDLFTRRPNMWLHWERKSCFSILNFGTFAKSGLEYRSSKLWGREMLNIAFSPLLRAVWYPEQFFLRLLLLFHCYICRILTRLLSTFQLKVHQVEKYGFHSWC